MYYMECSTRPVHELYTQIEATNICHKACRDALQRPGALEAWGQGPLVLTCTDLGFAPTCVMRGQRAPLQPPACRRGALGIRRRRPPSQAAAPPAGTECEGITTPAPTQAPPDSDALACALDPTKCTESHAAAALLLGAVLVH